MQPIFKEQMEMWKAHGYDLGLSEGVYWFDNHFICAFTPDGELHKLFKYKVFDNLTLEIKAYKAYKDKKSDKINFLPSDFETWEQTVERLSPELKTYEAEAERVIKQAIADYPDHEKVVMTSTGKDSMVTLDLVQRFIPNVKVYFNNTSLDTADTYKMVKAHKDWTIINPKIGFYKWIKQEHFIPTRFSRGCCTYFKEGETVNFFSDIPKLLFFMGVRNDESVTRADRQDFSKNPKWGNRDWISCLPIRKWSEFMIWLYILKYGIEINPKYKKGYSRVGCSVACCYYSKHTWVLDKYWYSKARQRWESILHEVFVQENRWTKCNSTIDEYVTSGWCGGLYRPEPNDEVINEFMKYKGLTDRNVALQYFNKTCCVCGKNVRQNDVLGMNLKLHSREVEKIYCKKHLMELHNMSPEEWDKNVEDFKAQGCKLF